MQEIEKNEEVLRSEIGERVKALFRLKKSGEKFVPIKTKVQYAGHVYDHEETIAVINALLDGWLGVGKNVWNFEKKLAKLVGVKEALMVNSGSSANLISIATLLSPQLDRDHRIKRGEEVITPAVTFPTTFNPIVQYGLVPVLVDVELGTYTVSPSDLKHALSKKTRAIMIPHTLGNPNEMDAIMDFAEEHNLYVVEDACDALGSTYNGRTVGSFGTFGTFSFYPAHHITTGEGGALVSRDTNLMAIARSLRDWGRACVCTVCTVSLDPNFNCPLRFEMKEDMPEDYDKRYVYVNVGYNLKPIEIQGALGLVQLQKLRAFAEVRKRNFRVLFETFQKYEDHVILPRSLPKSEPSWFAFPLTIRNKAPFKRKDIMEWFNKRNIEVKNFFAGNIIRQPAYKNLRHRRAQPLKNSDLIMRNSFFLGIYPGITEEKMEFVVDAVESFMQKYA